MLSKPPAVPRRLERLSASDSFTSAAAPAEVARTAVSRLRGWKTVIREEDGGVVTVAAEKGYLRETGNLVFHAALIVLLAGVAAGKLYGYQGTVLLTEQPAGYLQRGPAVRLVPAGQARRRGRAGTVLHRLARQVQRRLRPGRDAGCLQGRHHVHGRRERFSTEGHAAGQPPAAYGGNPGLSGGSRLRAAVHRDPAERQGIAGRLRTVPAAGAFDAAVRGRDQDPRHGHAGSAGAVRDVRAVRGSRPRWQDDLGLAAARQPRGGDRGLPRRSRHRQRSAAVGLQHRPDTDRQRQAEGGHDRPADPGQVGAAGRRDADHLRRLPAVGDDPGQPRPGSGAGALGGRVRSSSVSSCLSRSVGDDSSCGSRPRRAPIRESVDNSGPVDNAARPGTDARSVVAVGGLARTDAGSFGTEFARVVERLRDSSPVRKD